MKEIEVWADWYFLPEPQKVGVLTASITRGHEIFSFEYEKAWLNGKYRFQVDPQLQLYEGRFHTAHGMENFGAFLDSSPDRWGKTLMLRKEALFSKEEKRSVKTLMASDYLLGVNDRARMGGLRFKMGGVFLDADERNSIPPWTSIRALERASLYLEGHHSEKDPQFVTQLKLLLAPGSSLGGARPKAAVVDPENHLWIAKFPSKEDVKDVGGWEMVVHELAKNCKIMVPEARVQRNARKHHTFLTKRFDRLSNGKRVHFASAMTVLQRKDGDSYRSGTSYLELADFILESGAPARVKMDLEELWRRIVFSIAISNSDDHLRNHGFLLTEEGWELSPAYDMNPNELASGLSLNISRESNALDFELAKSVAQDFRISSRNASEVIKEIKAEVSQWTMIATRYGIGRSEQERMEGAFRV